MWYFNRDQRIRDLQERFCIRPSDTKEISSALMTLIYQKRYCCGIGKLLLAVLSVVFSGFDCDYIPVMNLQLLINLWQTIICCRYIELFPALNKQRDYNSGGGGEFVVRMRKSGFYCCWYIFSLKRKQTFHSFFLLLLQSIYCELNLWPNMEMFSGVQTHVVNTSDGKRH